ncbi:hypothetical protein Tco_1175896 [Tanacetum coccineum]
MIHTVLALSLLGADDEEISEGGIPRVIVLGYDRLPIQPVAPPSPDYIPGPEDPQTNRLFLQDEDDHGAYRMVLVDYPNFRGRVDGDDDDGDSSRDDANDEDEDGTRGEEHLAPADSAVIVPTDEPVSPTEGTRKLRQRLRRLLSMPTPSPSTKYSIHYHTPSTGERLLGSTKLAELHEHDTHDLYALLEDAQDSRSRISQRVDMDS